MASWDARFEYNEFRSMKTIKEKIGYILTFFWVEIIVVLILLIVSYLMMKGY